MMPNSKITAGEKMAVMANDITYIKKEVTEINQKLSHEYVTKIEFEPLKKVVYGLIALILTAVVSGILAVVIIR